jgi:citrate synthase
MHHTFVHSRLTEMMKTFNYDAHPMGMFISSMAAMSTFHANANPALKVFGDDQTSQRFG